MIRQRLKLLYRLGECRRAWRILEPGQEFRSILSACGVADGTAETRL
jgi:hypothetical protein